MIDYIIGIVFFPFSIILFLNMLGITAIQRIIGVPVLFIAVLGLIIVQVANIMGAHINNQFILQSWILCIVMMWPSIIYLTSGFITYPTTLITVLPAIIASFLFVEGIYSFYIDHEGAK